MYAQKGLQIAMRATHFSQYLQEREQLRLVDSPHWIYIAQAVIISVLVLGAGLWLAGFVGTHFVSFGGLGSLNAIINQAMQYIAFFLYWGTLIGTVFYFLNRVIFYLTTYVFMSDRRLFLKRGLLMVKVNELDFDEIRSAHLNYGFFGRILGYAQPLMDARFVDDIKLPFIHRPEEAMKVIHSEHDLQKDVALTLVSGGDLDGQANGNGRRPRLRTAGEYSQMLGNTIRNRTQQKRQQARATAYASDDLVFIDGDDNDSSHQLSYSKPHPRRRKSDKQNTQDYSSNLTKQITSGDDLEML